MARPEATLIISVYTNTTFLKVVLDSLREQTWKNFEVIISEDGESLIMKEFLLAYPFETPWLHLTQEDQGWRKNRALNRAILAAKADYLILIDGDCVLHPRFMEMHHRYAKENRILAGKRIKLNEESTKRILLGSTSLNGIQTYLRNHLLNLRKKGFKFQEEGFFFDPDNFWGFIPRIRKMTQLKGCNMSFSKTAILAINGFDEDYVRPAIGEDIDLTWRFKMAGHKLFSVRNLAVQYHLYHQENWSDQSKNIEMMEERQQANRFVCLNGIKKLFNMENLFLSIIICTYNGEKYLQKQLNSLINQSYINFEIIAIDDCSTDRSYEILYNLSKIDSRIKVLRNERNRGFNHNFEFGIQQAKGEFILICDQDDIWETKKLEVLLAHIDGSLLYYHDSELIASDDKPLNKKLSDRFKLGVEVNPLSFVALNCVTGHTCMFSREMLSLPMFPFPDHIFYDNWLGFIASTYGKIRFVNECLVKYRIHEQNNAVTKTKAKYLDEKTRRICFEEVNSFYQFTPDNAVYKPFLKRLRDTYKSNSRLANLHRVFLFLVQSRSLTAVRNKSGIHRVSLCLKMAYKMLPNHLE